MVNGDGSNWDPDAEVATPMTETVMDPTKLNTTFDDHIWVQQGYELIDMCANCPHMGSPIPFGKLLVKEDGRYKLVDETRPELDDKRATKDLVRSESAKAERRAAKET